VTAETLIDAGCCDAPWKRGAESHQDAGEQPAATPTQDLGSAGLAGRSPPEPGGAAVGRASS
jgi:hypothetical protein